MEKDRDRQAALTSHPRGSEFDGALAGLWENWLSPAANGVRSFAIITTKPNEVCGVHDRKPVVLGPEGVASLARRGNSGTVPTQSLSRDLSVGDMKCWPMSTRDDSVKNKDVSLVQPITAA